MALAREPGTKPEVRGRTGRRLVTGLLAVCVASVGLAACGTADRTSTTATNPAAAVSTPRGWKTYVYEQAAISVPANWRVVTDHACPGPKGPGTLVLGLPSQSAVGCADSAQFAIADTVTLATFPEAISDPGLGSCAPTPVNGLEVYIGPCSSSDAKGLIWWVVPALGVQAQGTQRGGRSTGKLSTTVVGRVLHSLRRATAREVVASSPVDWPTFTYQSAAISVPRSWSVRRDQNCPDQSAEGTLELGLPRVASTCVALVVPTVGITVSALTPDVAYASCSSFRVNGQRAYVGDCETRPPEGVTIWAIPSLGVEVAGSGSGNTESSALVDLILHTIRRATPQDLTASVPLSLRITLQHTRGRAGIPIRGTAIFTNRSGASILVEACAADGWLNVGLANHDIRYNPAHPLVACAPSVQLASGTVRIPITVMTTYQECNESGAGSAQVPPCLPENRLPPLPAGIYRTEVLASGLSAATPAPNVVTVTLTHVPKLRG